MFYHLHMIYSIIFHSQRKFILVPFCCISPHFSCPSFWHHPFNLRGKPAQKNASALLKTTCSPAAIVTSKEADKPSTSPIHEYVGCQGFHGCIRFSQLHPVAPGKRQTKVWKAPTANVLLPIVPETSVISSRRRNTFVTLCYPSP